MNKYFQGMMWSLLACGISVNSFAGENPIFLVTPNVRPPLPNANPSAPLLVQGELGTSIYQVINNSNRVLSNISIKNLPSGVTQVSNTGPDYCTSTTQLTSPGSLCLIELQTNTNVASSVSGGPIICSDNGARCSQPYSADQLAVSTTAGPIPQTCTGNESNFSYELTQPFDTTPITEGWGPARNHLLLSSSNPNLTVCPTVDPTNTTAVTWMQNRVINAEDYWVKQKINYCHHHVTDFYTPTTVTIGGVPTARTAITSGGGFCSNATNLYPGATFGQAIRWNYSNSGSETSDFWVNKNRMWYGVDCSDFTSFIYNFAFGIQFNSDTGYQAGQATNGSQDDVIPNGQDLTHLLQQPNNSDPNSAAGVLVCKNGSTEVTTGPNAYCGSGGSSGLCVGGSCPNGYFSVFRGPIVPHGLPTPHPEDITPTMLTLLKPGDLIFLAFPPGSGKGDGNNPTSVVTHVITWTGKQVGYGPNNINPSLIAPESICPNNWQPQIGDWVIIDSHYQGPDYRVFSSCFYGNNVYGVRRVIGHQQ